MDENWRDECLQHREALALIAEALGWKDVRQSDGTLHLPCGEDVVTVIRERLGVREVAGG